MQFITCCCEDVTDDLYKRSKSLLEKSVYHSISYMLVMSSLVCTKEEKENAYTKAKSMEAELPNVKQEFARLVTDRKDEVS